MNGPALSFPITESAYFSSAAVQFHAHECLEKKLLQVLGHCFLNATDIRWMLSWCALIIRDSEQWLRHSLSTRASAALISSHRCFNSQQRHARPFLIVASYIVASG